MIEYRNETNNLLIIYIFAYRILQFLPSPDQIETAAPNNCFQVRSNHEWSAAVNIDDQSQFRVQNTSFLFWTVKSSFLLVLFYVIFLLRSYFHTLLILRSIISNIFRVLDIMMMASLKMLSEYILKNTDEIFAPAV